jgi:hypothetical protein
MLVIATKRQFVIGTALALVLTFGLNVSNYFKTIPQGELLAVNGTIKVEKVWKNKLINFTGDGRAGVCNLSGCNKNEVYLIDGGKVIVKMDSKGVIFEINSNGNIVFGKNDVDSEKTRTIVISIFLILLLTFCIFFIISSKGKNVSHSK